MAGHLDPTFEVIYGATPAASGLVPWDIGVPQPVVEPLGAVGNDHLVHLPIWALAATRLEVTTPLAHTNP